MKPKMLAPVCQVVALLATLGSCYTIGSQYYLQDEHDSPIARVTADEWHSFNQSVRGRLQIGLPVGLPCYNNFNGKSKRVEKDECKVVEDNKSNTGYLVTQPGGYCQGNWGICQASGVGCPTSPFRLIDPNALCHQGAVPNFFVDVQSVSDVQEALVQAARLKLPVVVKNSGHDYKGRSAGPGALGIWIHNYRPGPKLEKAFKPEGCKAPVGNVITFGAGQDFNGLYKFADQNNLTIAGGSAATVAPAGGWITGGGHSALSPVFGLGVDNVQQVRVVLPNGTYVTANSCQNQDIFFAVRGGGGGTFGVNMEMSMLAHPQQTLQFAMVNFTNLNEDNQRQFLSILAENANQWFDAGWGGYAYPAGKRPYYSAVLMNPLISLSEAKAALKPLSDIANALGQPMNFTTYSSFYELYLDHIQGSLTTFGNFGLAQASRLVPRDDLHDSHKRTEVVDTLMTAVGPTTQIPLALMLLLTTPSRSIKDKDSSITPAWRNATWHVIYTSFWDPSTVTPTDTYKIFKTVTESMDPLRAITPEGGAYLNEGDTYEPDPIGAFWGEKNHERLLSIKREIDPRNIMQVRQGIGSDPRGRFFECYPPVRDAGPRDEL